MLSSTNSFQSLLSSLSQREVGRDFFLLPAWEGIKGRGTRLKRLAKKAKEEYRSVLTQSRKNE
ncbi:MAG: hypothetical protein CVU64_21390 [Deltaproteobacteria bacterium HGW-Deltaproteobacteria-21]|nr:MAG: hypothetical protein CVU64_21390 [Deltaproteobacteria bacterium HGW-Deltaproteobacteria-21]